MVDDEAVEEAGDVAAAGVDAGDVAVADVLLRMLRSVAVVVVVVAVDGEGGGLRYSACQEV